MMRMDGIRLIIIKTHPTLKIDTTTVRWGDAKFE